MAWVFRGGKLLMVGGKAVTNDECCCDNCVEPCDDETISVTLPAFTGGGGGDIGLLGLPKLGLPALGVPQVGLPAFADGCDCEDAGAGPWTLDKWIGDEEAGCCYWKNEVGGGSIVSIYAVLCISGTDPNKIATLTLTVNCAGGVVQEFEVELAICDFCGALPGIIYLPPISGDCDTEESATILFASVCCSAGDCCILGTIDIGGCACADDTIVVAPLSIYVPEDPLGLIMTVESSNGDRYSRAINADDEITYIADANGPGCHLWRLLAKYYNVEYSSWEYGFKTDMTPCADYVGETLDMWLTLSNYQRIQRNDETCS